MLRVFLAAKVAALGSTMNVCCQSVSNFRLFEIPHVLFPSPVSLGVHLEVLSSTNPKPQKTKPFPESIKTFLGYFKCKKTRFEKPGNI